MIVAKRQQIIVFSCTVDCKAYGGISREPENFASCFFYIFVAHIYFDIFYEDKFKANAECVLQTRKVYF
jgi:hypothetical protein